jgi:hypothetical protein
MDTLICKECDMPIRYTEKDDAFYKLHSYPPPKRCKSCRDKRKAMDSTH